MTSKKLKNYLFKPNVKIILFSILGVVFGTYSSIFVASPVLKFLKVSYKTLEKKEEKIVP